MNDNSHAVIARVASYGNSDQQAWAKEAAVTWEKMEAYVAEMFPNDGGLKY